MKMLSGHISPETAYLVEDYPYGFRLRCKIRYWLEYSPKHGVRFCSQTSNPKKEMLFWNKPECSTYDFISGAMYLDDDGHVAWSGLNAYSGHNEAALWNQQFREGAHPESIPTLDRWIETKRRYEEKKAGGMDWQQAGAETVLEMNGLRKG